MGRNLSDVLEFYGLEGARVRKIGDWFNATYSVRWEDYRFLLRLHGKADFSAAFIESELEFLDWLLWQAPFAIQKPIRGKNGEWLTRWQGRFVSVLRWIDAEIPEMEGFTPQQLRALGQMIGQFHNVSQTYELPATFQRPGADSSELFGSGRPGCMVSAGWIAADERSKRLLEHAKQLTLDAERSLGRSAQTFGVIHGDLHFSNIVAMKTGFAPIDFDDMGLGFYAYELAVPLAKMLRLGDFAARKTALLEGYTSARNLSPREVELLPVFMIARTASILLWSHGAGAMRPDLRASVTGYLGDLTDKLERQLNAI